MTITNQQTQFQLVKGTEPVYGASKPFLSIVVCAYRHSDYIEECLASINATEIHSFELVIIDDGSPDDTLRKCIDFPFSPNIDIRIYTKPNRGLVDSLRCGLALASGIYVAFMASDDCYTPGGLEAAMICLQKDKSIDALLCQAQMFGSDERLVYGPSMDVFFKKTSFERLDQIWSEAPAPMLLQATVFKTDFLHYLKPWSNDLELDDWPTFIRLFAAEAQHGAVIEYKSTFILSKYRIHAEGIHANLDRQLRITEQVAREFVPLKYRGICLANVRIDIGLGHCRDGRWFAGLLICGRGLFASPSMHTVMRVFKRVLRFLANRFTPA